MVTATRRGEAAGVHFGDLGEGSSEQGKFGKLIENQHQNSYACEPLAGH